MLSVICETTCPPPPSNINRLKEICTQNGGNPILRTDHNSCNYFDCSFANNPNFYSGYDRCFTESEIENVKIKCDKLGLPFHLINAGPSCEVAKCGQSAPTDECPTIPLNERNSIETECALDGLVPIQVFSENGCASLQCGTPDECTTELPEAVYENCNLRGGELIVRKDINECVTFIECLTRGNDRDISVDLDEIPTSEELLSIVLKVEAINSQMLETSAELERIGAYYESLNSAEAARFKAASTSLGALIKEIEDSKEKLKERIENEELTMPDVREFIYELKFTIKVGLEDVLWQLLASTKETEEEVGGDCGFDYNCFENSFRICEPTTFKPEEEKGERSITVEIKGIENGSCVLTATLPEGEGPPAGTFPELETPYTMNCKTEKYALGASQPEKTIFPYCTGSLAELINTYAYGNEEETSSVVTASVIAFLDKNQGPGACAGNLECIKFCNRHPIDCLGYIEKKLETNAGPGGTRTITEMEAYCDNNQASCESWFSSKGVALDTLNEKKANAKYFSISGDVIRRE